MPLGHQQPGGGVRVHHVYQPIANAGLRNNVIYNRGDIDRLFRLAGLELHAFQFDDHQLLTAVCFFPGSGLARSRSAFSTKILCRQPSVSARLLTACTMFLISTRG